jgi:DNA replication protein DnaC
MNMTIKHEEWIRRQRVKELRTLPIPNEYRDKTWADVRVHDGNADAVAFAQGWLRESSRYIAPSSNESGKGLLLVGPTGSGKTLMASVAAQDLVRRARRPGLVHFTTMEGFNRHRLRKMELGRLLDRDEDVAEEWFTHDKAIERCYEVRVLVLDDVGQENTTPHLAKMVNELLRDRYARGCPTIITSNVDPDQWGARFKSESLASFILQACFPLPVVAEDGRRAVG